MKAFIVFCLFTIVMIFVFSFDKFEKKATPETPWYETANKNADSTSSSEKSILEELESSVDSAKKSLAETINDLFSSVASLPSLTSLLFSPKEKRFEPETFDPVKYANNKREALKNTHEKYGKIIKEKAEKFGLPYSLVLATKVKENDDVTKNPMQVEDATAKEMGYSPSIVRNNFAIGVEAGCEYLKKCLDEKSGNINEASVAYRYGKKSSRDDDTSFEDEKILTLMNEFETLFPTEEQPPQALIEKKIKTDNIDPSDTLNFDVF